MWELNRLESRSWRAHLQQVTIQEFKQDPTHPRNSRSSQTSPSHHQDRLARSWTKSNILATTKVVTDGKELDNPEGEHKPRPQNQPGCWNKYKHCAQKSHSGS